MSLLDLLLEDPLQCGIPPILNCIIRSGRDQKGDQKRSRAKKGKERDEGKKKQTSESIEERISTTCPADAWLFPPIGCRVRGER